MRFQLARLLRVLGVCAALAGCRFGYDHNAERATGGAGDGDDPFAALDGGAGNGDAPGDGDGDGDAPATDGSVPYEPGRDAESDASLDDAGMQMSYEPGDAGAHADAGSSAPVTSSVSFTNPVDTPLRGGTGGSPFAEDCPASYAIVGYQGYVNADPGSWVMRIQALCAKITVTDGVLAIAKPLALAEHGTDGNTAWQRSCPKGSVVMGFEGRTGQYLDQLVLWCAPLQVSGSAGSYTFSVGASTPLAAVGGTGGTTFAPSSCANNQIAFGHSGRSGQWVDALSLACGSVVANP